MLPLDNNEQQGTTICTLPASGRAQQPSRAVSSAGTTPLAVSGVATPATTPALPRGDAYLQTPHNTTPAVHNSGVLPDLEAVLLSRGGVSKPVQCNNSGNVTDGGDTHLTCPPTSHGVVTDLSNSKTTPAVSNTSQQYRVVTDLDLGDVNIQSVSGRGSQHVFSGPNSVQMSNSGIFDLSKSKTTPAVSNTSQQHGVVTDLCLGDGNIQSVSGRASQHIFSGPNSVTGLQMSNSGISDMSNSGYQAMALSNTGQEHRANTGVSYGYRDIQSTMIDRVSKPVQYRDKYMEPWASTHGSRSAQAQAPADPLGSRDHARVDQGPHSAMYPHNARESMTTAGRDRSDMHCHPVTTDVRDHPVINGPPTSHQDYPPDMNGRTPMTPAYNRGPPAQRTPPATHLVNTSGSQETPPRAPLRLVHSQREWLNPLNDSRRSMGLTGRGSVPSSQPVGPGVDMSRSGESMTPKPPYPAGDYHYRGHVAYGGYPAVPTQQDRTPPGWSPPSGYHFGWSSTPGYNPYHMGYYPNHAPELYHTYIQPPAHSHTGGPPGFGFSPSTEHYQDFTPVVEGQTDPQRSAAHSAQEVGNSHYGAQSASAPYREPSPFRCSHSRNEYSREGGPTWELKWKQKFSGRGDTTLDLYLAQFERVAQSNNWDNSMMANMLMASLEGESLKVLTRVPDKPTYQQVVIALRKRFPGPTLEDQTTALARISRQPGEDIRTYANRLEDLFDQVFPDMPPLYRDRQLLWRLKKSLPEEVLRMFLMAPPQSFAEAVQLVYRLDQFDIDNPGWQTNSANRQPVAHACRCRSDFGNEDPSRSCAHQECATRATPDEISAYQSSIVQILESQGLQDPEPSAGLAADGMGVLLAAMAQVAQGDFWEVFAAQMARGQQKKTSNCFFCNTQGHPWLACSALWDVLKKNGFQPRAKQGSSKSPQSSGTRSDQGQSNY